MNLIRTTPATTEDGRPFDFYVREQVRKGNWRLEVIPKAILGTPRDLEVYRARRKTKLIADWSNRAEDRSYCCEYWADLKIGHGACGYRCAECFLLLTHRVKADPSRHVLYENTEDLIRAVAFWLKKPERRQTPGLGIDCSDSLLYKGVTGYARSLAPPFARPESNPFGRHLVLLTKSANVGYLQCLPARNVIVSSSLNPQEIADVFERRSPDGLRITPGISERLEASVECERMGLETRWRIDPIIPLEGWQDIYRGFFGEASKHRPGRITLGIYPRMGQGLRTFSLKWGLRPMPWNLPGKPARDGGDHLQLPRRMRIQIYREVKRMVHDAWPEQGMPLLALCKEGGEVRRAAGIPGLRCNCE